MRLFKRRSVDQSPELVSATPISQDGPTTTTSVSDNAAMPPPAARAPKIVQRQARTPPSTSTLRRSVNSPNPNSRQQREAGADSETLAPPPLPRKLESQTKLKSTPLSFSAKSLSSLSKKVGEKWHQLKRADSSELLSSSKKVVKKSSDAPTTPASSPDLGKTKRVGRIESLRNLFRSTSSSSLSGACSSRSNSKSRASTGNEPLERRDSGSGQQLEKSLSEGALKMPTRPRAELERRRLELLRDIQEMERQNRLFEFILGDEKSIATSEGCTLARRTMQQTDSTILRRRQMRLVEGEAMRHRERKTSDGSDLSGKRSSRTSASSNELRAQALVADPFGEEQGLGDDLVLDPRRESVRSCELKGLEDLMSALKLGGGDESGYDTESTRNGADSPDSGASVPIASTSSTAPTSDGPVALVDYEGVDLSTMPLDSPDKPQQRPIPPRKKRLRSEDISEEPEHRSHLVSPAERHHDDATLVAEDDNDPNGTTRTETTILASTDVPLESPKTPKKQQQPTPLRQRLSFRPQRQVPNLRTPEKKRPAPEAPPRTASRLSQRNPLLRSCSKSASRRLSNASVLNLLDNASSPSKDSPPRSSLPLSSRSTPPRPRPCNAKRSHAELEAEESDGAPIASSSPVEATPAKSKLRRPIFDRTSVTRRPSGPLPRRELRTMKLRVERAGELGLSVHRCQAARPYFVVSALDEQGEAAKSGLFRMGDEVVRLCGRRLRGMSLAEARGALRSCHGDVELQIAREPNFLFGEEPGDTWERTKLDGVQERQQRVERSKSEAEVWGPMTLKPGSPVRLEFEDTAMTTSGAEQVEDAEEEMLSASQSTVAVDDEERDAEMGDDEAEACEVVGAITKDGRRLSALEMECCPSAEVISVDEPKPTSGMLKFQVRRRSNTLSSDQGGIRRRAASMSMDVLTIELDKGAKQALGFTIVGGADSPNGAMGIYVKSILPGGQASEQGSLRAKDEILAVNGQSLEGLTHAEAVQLVKTARKGKLVLHVARRDPSSSGRTRLISSRSGL